MCTVYCICVSVVTVPISAMSSSTFVSDIQHSTSSCHSPPTVAELSNYQSGFTDDHVTNMAVNNTIWSPPDIDGPDRPLDDTNEGSSLSVAGEMVRTVEERDGVTVKTSNANGVCYSRGPAAAGTAKTSLLSRSGGLHRRLNAVVRDRIIFFTKRDRSTSARC